MEEDAFIRMQRVESDRDSSLFRDIFKSFYEPVSSKERIRNETVWETVPEEERDHLRVSLLLEGRQAHR